MLQFSGYRFGILIFNCLIFINKSKFQNAPEEGILFFKKSDYKRELTVQANLYICRGPRERIEEDTNY